MTEIDIQETKTPSVFFDHATSVVPHCPFLGPAMARDLLFQSHLTLAHGDERDEWQIFRAGVMATEWLRRRRIQSAGAAGQLICVNIIVEGPDGRSLEQALAWPHYCLKTLYTEVGVMFGKFWIGEDDTSRRGAQLPIPPMNFLSVRSAVVARDPYFFTKAPELLPDLVASDDDMRDVLPPGMSSPALIGAEDYDRIKAQISERIG